MHGRGAHGSRPEASVDPVVMAAATVMRLQGIVSRELPGTDAVIRRDGERLILEPAPPRSLLALLDTLDELEEEFPEIDDPPPEPVDI